LRRLGIDIVKIDGAFVQNVARSLDDRFFVRTLAGLARHLGIRTVAEWVEDAEARRLLGEWEIDYLQGHFVGRPEIYEPRVAEARSA
jgi:EAL domain-containing protein (putative c-di-GMP-specific phosphodiesterase class I)